MSISNIQFKYAYLVLKNCYGKIVLSSSLFEILKKTSSSLLNAKILTFSYIFFETKKSVRRNLIFD